MIISSNESSDDEVVSENLSLDETSLSDLTAALESIRSNYSVLSAALETIDDFTNNRISAESFKYAVFAIESAAFGGDHVPEHTIVPSMEGIVSHLVGVIKYLIQSLMLLINKAVDAAQYLLTVYNKDEDRILDMVGELRKQKWAVKKISVRCTKYNIKGPDTVLYTFSDYFKAYKEFSTELQPFCSSVSGLATNDFAGPLKSIVKGTFMPGQEYISRTLSVYKVVNAAKQRFSHGKSERHHAYTIYHSGDMVGMLAATCILPNTEPKKSQDFNEIYGVSKFINIYMHRYGKFTSGQGMFKKLDYEVDRVKLIELLEESIKLQTAVTKALSILTKMGSLLTQLPHVLEHIPLVSKVLSEAERANKYVDPTIRPLENFAFSRGAEEHQYSVAYIKLLRFQTKIGMMVFDTIPSTANAVSGNIKHLLSMASQVSE